MSDLPKLEILDVCFCDNEIAPFTTDSTHSIIIRRYVGQHGHLVDVAYHPECYEQWRTIGGIMGKHRASIETSATVRRDFEDEARKRGWPLGRIGEITTDPTYDREAHGYADPSTEARWEAWQATGELYGKV